jgi:hypothetical protein
MTSHLRKGALVAIDPRTGAVLTSWAFQYNPETLVRQILPITLGGEGEQQPGDPPCEELFLSFELDAAEGPELGKPGVAEPGLLPALSALELMVYSEPDGRERTSEEEHRIAGAPLQVFVWGDHRRAPVRIAACTITEEAFDAELAPTRARVDLTLHVLTFGDSPPAHPGRRLFREYMQAKERLAAQR